MTEKTTIESGKGSKISEQVRSVVAEALCTSKHHATRMRKARTATKLAATLPTFLHENYVEWLDERNDGRPYSGINFLFWPYNGINPMFYT